VLVIRQEQMRAFEVAQRQRFEDGMIAHLTTRFAGSPAVADKEELRALIREGLQLASKYGIVVQYDLRRFLEFRTEYGSQFQTIPWIARILNDSTLSGCGKMEQMDAQSLFAVRQ
jgi:hypothetical protein